MEGEPRSVSPTQELVEQLFHTTVNQESLQLEKWNEILSRLIIEESVESGVLNEYLQAGILAHQIEQESGFIQQKLKDVEEEISEMLSHIDCVYREAIFLKVSTDNRNVITCVHHLAALKRIAVLIETGTC
jgi:hypothetical protein